MDIGLVVASVVGSLGLAWLVASRYATREESLGKLILLTVSVGAIFGLLLAGLSTLVQLITYHF